MKEVKKLTVQTDELRMQWIQVLEAAANYHWDMSGLIEPEIKTPEGSSKDELAAKMHRGWARAIQEAAFLVNEWDAEEDGDIKHAS